MSTILIILLCTQEQENEATDFGELNLEEEEIAEENNDLQDRDEQGAEEEGAVSDIEEEMDVTNDPPSPSGPDQEEIEQEEQGGGDGYTQEMEDMEEDVDMESRSYSNSDAVYGVPQTQSTEADVRRSDPVATQLLLCWCLYDFIVLICTCI